MKRERLYWLLPLIVFGFIPNILQAQIALVDIVPNVSEQRVNQEISFIFSISEPADAYFFSLEATYDPLILEFAGEDPSGLTAGGLSISDELGNGNIGASVSRTTPLAGASAGELLRLNFRVRSFADPGTQSISITNMRLSDSAGDPVLIESNTSAEFTVLEDIGDLRINGDSAIVVTEGDPYLINASVQSSGVTDAEGQENRLRVWAGVQADDTDPEFWDESVWRLMEFSQRSGDQYLYDFEAAFGRPIGNYLIALRADLDQSGLFRYGGINGFWDTPASPSAALEIIQQSAFRYTLAEWNFDEQSYETSTAIPVNEGTVMELSGASLSGFSSGANGLAANSNGWNNFVENSSYWITKISTENFESIQVSSRQSGSNTGPRDFQLQISSDSLSWTEVPGGNITVRNDSYQSGSLTRLELPAEANDQSVLYLRWLQVSDFRIDDTEPVSSTGTNRLDEVSITGINPLAGRVAVWPGDTDNNGSVEIADVLPLGIHWLKEGPTPIYDKINWEARESESWIPQAATYADADGSGRVDQNDLQPVGLNFGELRSQSRSDGSSLSTLDIGPLKMGRIYPVNIELENIESITGYAFEIVTEGVGENILQIEEQMLDWIMPWSDSGKLIQYNVNRNRSFAAASVHKGKTEGIEVKDLVQIQIKVLSDTEAPVRIYLNELTLSTPDGLLSVEKADLVSRLSVGNEDENDLPAVTELLPNFPNPFNPVTVITYNLSKASDVSLIVYNALGQKVSTLLNAQQAAGEYRISFDGSGLSSGIYFYELRTSGDRFVRKMMLLK